MALRALSARIVTAQNDIQNKLPESIRNIEFTPSEYVQMYNTDMEMTKTSLNRRKTKCELVRICCMIAGIELCYAAETAFVSPILLRLRVPVIYMTMIWCLSPLLGLFLNPLFGSLSDRCYSKLGRRRPFIIGLSSGIIVGLILVPNGQFITSFIRPTVSEFSNVTCTAMNCSNISHMTSTESDSSAQSYSAASIEAIIVTACGVMLLDFCCDACQSPARTYLLDICVPEDHKIGLTTFTLVSGVGGALGYIMGAIDWASAMSNNSFPFHVRTVFSVVLVLLILLVAISVTSFAEVPLQKPETASLKPKAIQRRLTYRRFSNVSYDDEDSVVMEHLPRSKSFDGTTNNLKSSSSWSHDTKLEGDNPIGLSNRSKSEDHIVFQEAPETKEVTLKEYLKSVIFMPRSILILCITNLFCWMALLCYSLYFTDFVGQAVFGGDPTAPHNTKEHKLYSDGVRLGSGAMAMYSISCSLYSLAIEPLVIRFGARPVYIISILSSSVGTILMATFRTQTAVIILSPTVGIIYATLFTMPYIVIAHYHNSQQFEELVPKDAQKFARGLGTDVAVVSSMVFVSQFILSIGMGSVIHATGSTTTVIIASAISSALAAIFASQVTYMGL